MNTKNVNILLVEDDEVNQLIACLMIRKWNMQVSVAKNGAEAVSMIKDKTYNLVLMDIQMPVMDGFESTRQIRDMKDPYFKSVPIIAFSASGLVDVQSKATVAGMTDFISKPLVLEELQEKIKKYVHSKKRPLLINFNVYTDGDPNFKKELISLLINNITELQQALISQANVATKALLGVIHKVKATVSMLSDEEFSYALEEINTLWVTGDRGDRFNQKLNNFNGLCNQVIESLQSA